MFKLYKFLNLLSIDIVLGALSSTLMASHLLEVKIPFSWWICLAMAIWIIYTTDHLIDTWKLKASDEKRRKFYHQFFFELFVATIILALTTSIISFLFLDFKIIAFGCILGLFTAGYLVLIFVFGQKRKVWLQKELYVSIIYTAGIWGSNLIMTEKIMEIEIAVIISSFFLLVFSDILTFSIYEYEQDKKNKFTSLISLIGIKKVSLISSTSLIISIFSSFLLFFLAEEEKILFTSFILLIMAVLLFLNLRFSKTFTKKNTYRYLGEAVFFLPALVVMV